MASKKSEDARKARIGAAVGTHLCIRALTVQMYAHTRAAERSAASAGRAVSEQFVRTAPVQRLSDAERAARMRRLETDIAEHYLNSPPPASILREGLSRWEGVRVR